jgi:hypothetical protein
VENLSEEWNLGSREKSPETVEPTPALGIEEGRLSNISEVDNETVVGEIPPSSEMSGTGPKKTDNQGKEHSNLDMQALISMMQQLSQQFQQSEERLKENSKQSEERVVLECQKSREQLKKELFEKVTTEVEKVATRVEKVVVEMDQVKQEVKKWQGKLEREMVGVKQQFERERAEQGAKVEQLAKSQEAENTKINQKIEAIQETVVNHKAETDREIISVKITVDAIQKGLEDNISHVSRRLREQDDKLARQNKADQLNLKTEIQNLQKEVNQIKLKTTGDEMQVPVRRSETMTEGDPVNISRDINPQEIDPSPENSNAESLKVTGTLGSAEFALPAFDESKGMNPVAHIRQLEEFFQFRGISKRLWLIVAKKSITGSVSKQWLEATNMKFTYYEQFKSEFLSTWWSAAQQGLVKCKLYQSKYDKTAGLSLSAHFLKYATMASYLEPKLTDYEVIEALRCHYPQEIQKLLISTRLCTIAEVLEVLKRLELMEERSSAFDVGPRSSNTQQRSPQNRSGDSKFEGSGQVRQVQSYIPRGRENWRTDRGRNSYRDRGYREDRNRQGENRNYTQDGNSDWEGNTRGERPRATEEN